MGKSGALKLPLGEGPDNKGLLYLALTCRNSKEVVHNWSGYLYNIVHYDFIVDSINRRFKQEQNTGK